MRRLFERGIIVRNQAVLQRGVNDDAEDDAAASSKRLGHVQRPPLLRLRPTW